MEPVVGIEPTTDGLQNRCSTAELNWPGEIDNRFPAPFKPDRITSSTQRPNQAPMRHGFRHLFATRCIESGVDIPTVSRWLGHQDGGALCMKTYGPLMRRTQHQRSKKGSEEGCI